MDGLLKSLGLAFSMGWHCSIVRVLKGSSFLLIGQLLSLHLEVAVVLLGGVERFPRLRVHTTFSCGDRAFHRLLLHVGVRKDRGVVKGVR